MKVSSDTRSLNRGNLIIGDDWSENYNHRFLHPAQDALPTDYGFVTHESIRMMFIEGAEWSQTPEYHLLKCQIEAGLVPYGLRDYSDLKRRGDQLNATYQSMASKGYRMSQELGSNYWDEAHFYLGRNGEICVGRHGNHRLAIARVLGITHFPAIFGGVHMSHVRTIGAAPDEVRSAVFGLVAAHPSVVKIL